MFYKAAERSSIAGGKIFDAVNDYSESGDALLEKLARITGVKGYNWIEPTNGAYARKSMISGIHCVFRFRGSPCFHHAGQALPRSLFIGMGTS
jgi:hypothetical protein